MSESQQIEAALSMMDLRHVGYHTPRTPCINIVESPSAQDLLMECQEGVALHAALRQARVPCRYYLATNKETLLRALQYIAMQRHFAPRPIALHISSHGNDAGIGLTSGDFVTWDQLRALLVDFGIKSCSYIEEAKASTLILCMSTCFGLAAHLMAKKQDRPFMTLVAPCCTVTWSDSLTAFLAFYNLFLQKNKSCAEAIRGMNAAAGEDELFHTIDFSEETKAWVAAQPSQ